MKTVFKAATAVAAALTLAACSGSETSVDTSAAQNVAEAAASKAAPVDAQNIDAVAAKTKAVLIYADWCGSCKVLDPKVQAVKAMGALPGLEFVTLDFTYKDETEFYAQAEAAGVGAAVKAYLNGTVKTGQLLLVDMDDQKVVGKVTKTLDGPQILSALKDAIAAS